MSRIDLGDPAPELTLTTQSGGQITLAQYRGKNAVVLFFYPNTLQHDGIATFNHRSAKHYFFCKR